MPRAQKCTKTTREDKSGVDFNFVNGTAVTILLSDLSSDIVTDLALHGLSQKGGDSYAGIERIDDAVAALNGVKERLLAGEWKAAREGGNKPNFSKLVRALFMATEDDVTEEDCRETVASLDDDGRKELRQHPQIDALIKQIDAEAAAERAKAALAKAAESTTPFALPGGVPAEEAPAKKAAGGKK